MRKYFVGLDVHLSHTNACILDAHGKEVKRLTVHGAWSRVIEEPAELKANLSVCYGASRRYSYLYDQFDSVARRVVVAHPGQLRLIFRSKRKDDRVDARKPAKLLFLDEAPTVFVPSQNVRAGRQLIEVRVRLVNKRTRAKHSRRALPRSLGIRGPRGLGLWRRRKPPKHGANPPVRNHVASPSRRAIRGASGDVIYWPTANLTSLRF